MLRTWLKKSFLWAFIGAVFILYAYPQSIASPAWRIQAGYIAVGHEALIPYGWVDFCERYTSDCEGGILRPMDINLYEQSFDIIKKINSQVNHTIKPMSDMQHWGVVDRWDLPTDGYGDCEDYVLLKRKLLIENGFPRQALLITIVRDLQGEGHAVLTVKTNQGEFILDNLSDEIRPWKATHYRFVKRQSQYDANVWVDLGDPEPAPMIVSK